MPCEIELVHPAGALAALESVLAVAPAVTLRFDEDGVQAIHMDMCFVIVCRMDKSAFYRLPEKAVYVTLPPSAWRQLFQEASKSKSVPRLSVDGDTVKLLFGAVESGESDDVLELRQVSGAAEGEEEELSDSVFRLMDSTSEDFAVGVKDSSVLVGAMDSFCDFQYVVLSAEGDKLSLQGEEPKGNARRLRKRLACEVLRSGSERIGCAVLYFQKAVLRSSQGTVVKVVRCETGPMVKVCSRVAVQAKKRGRDGEAPGVHRVDCLIAPRVEE